jgi:hypothetical protein
LNITEILVIDSSPFTLWDDSKNEFSGVKFHACFDILTGELHWFEMTSGSKHLLYLTQISSGVKSSCFKIVSGLYDVESVTIRLSLDFNR